MAINKLGQIVPMPLRRMAYKARFIPDKIKLQYQTIIAEINPKPILILGNQKSGTSAIAALLADMTGLSLSLDLQKEIDRPTYQRVKTGELPFPEFVKINKLDFSREIVKEPNLTILYEELVGYFPDSKFVFVIRDPRDNIRSILNRLKVPGNLSQLNPKSYKEVNRTWDLIIDNRWFGLQGENYIEMLADRWNYTADVFLKNQDKIILTRYEDFLKDKIGELASLAEKLGLSQVNDIKSKLDIQFQPKGNRNVKWREFFGDENLARIDRICSERMNFFTYLLSSEGENSQS